MAIHKDFAIVKTVLCSVTSLLKVSLGPSVHVCLCACAAEGGVKSRSRIVPAMGDLAGV